MAAQAEAYSTPGRKSVSARSGSLRLRLWRLADSYPAAQTEVLGVLPKLVAPVLYLGKANRRRLHNPRQGRSSQ